MQDQYAGDVGDFGKYGLLRSLFPPPVRLGVVWWLYPNEAHKTDGRHVAYLERDDFRQCDPELFDTLKEVVGSGLRSVAEIERRRLLGNAVYFSERLDFPRPRIEARKQWLQRALDRTANCHAVFLDPDNGLEIGSCDRGSKPAGKFVYLDEVQPFVERGQTVVLYHHLCRQGSHGSQISYRRTDLGRFGKVIALRYRSYSARVYFILPRSPLGVERFLQTPWRNHFERV